MEKNIAKEGRTIIYKGAMIRIESAVASGYREGVTASPHEADKIAHEVYEALNRPEYPPHHFVSFGVSDIREALEYEEAGEYPTLERLTNEELDGLLYRAWLKGWVFWECDTGLDLWELERLAIRYCGKEDN